MSTLDPQALILSKEERFQLDSYRHEIDHELLSRSSVFIDLLEEIYSTKVEETEVLISSLHNHVIDLNEKDSLLLAEEQKPVSENERKKKWIQWIKLQILWDAAYQIGPNGNLNSISLDSLNLFKQHVINKEQCHLNAFREAGMEIKNYVFESYLHSICHAFDPHTNYFNANDEAEFTSMLSKEAPSFGFDLYKNEDGELGIGTILPGGPAWNSNELNEGDVILSVKGDKQKAIDLSCISVDEASSYLMQADLSSATFRVRKSGGEHITLTLTKDKVTVLENSIQSHILNGEQRIGYMYLPTFYSGEAGVTWLPNGCANDVGKELIRLEKEKIDGLILDLRDNGGGSMLEALRLAGIFIDFGALSVAKYKDLEPETMKDMSRGMAYTGPLVVLVNELSASASELFSACIQDHKRGLIVGNRTFGKSTIQEVVPLQVTEKGAEFVKLTIGQFYRVTGASIQQIGIEPDVKLPSPYQDEEIGERFYPSCLPAGTIDKKTYYTQWWKPAPVEKLQRLSAERVAKDSVFNAIISTTKEDTLEVIPLDVSSFQKYFAKLQETSSEVDSTYRASDKYEVTIPSYRNLKLETESLSQTLDEEVRTWISRDIYISEGYNIINDLIKLSTK